MAQTYSNDVVEDLVWSVIQDSHCAQDFLDFIDQFPNPDGRYWSQALDRAVATFSPADPRGDQSERLYPGVYERIKNLANETQSNKARAVAYFQLGKMLQLGFGVAADRDHSISCYQQAISLGEIRSLINCGAHYDGPNATPQELALAHDLFERARLQGEPMGLVRMANRIEDKKDPRKYGLYLQAAEMGMAEGLYQVGMAHYFGKCNQAEDESLGISWLQRAARAGWPGACRILGWHYERSTTKDSQLAWDWYLLGAQLGDAACMHAIGLQLLWGVDRETDTSQAMHWFSRAAVLGDNCGQFRVGQQFLVSENSADHPQGLAWLRLAMDNGHGHAAWRLALAHRDGIGCVPDPAESSRYCEIAARAGLPEAQGQLGLNYWYGNGVIRDEQKAYQWLQMCALQGEPRGTYLLGLATDCGVGCSADTEEAVRLYHEAADKGDLDAVNQIGDCFYFGRGKPKDAVQAAMWYRRAAAKGHAASMADLGRMLHDGEGVLVNYEEAFKWFERAAQLKDSRAMYMLAIMYGNGDGVEESEEQCRHWMSRSAMLGHTPAKEWMEENLPAVPQWLEDLVQPAAASGVNNSATQQSDQQLGE